MSKPQSKPQRRLSLARQASARVARLKRQDRESNSPGSHVPALQRARDAEQHIDGRG